METRILHWMTMPDAPDLISGVDPLSCTDKHKARRIMRLVSINLHKNVTAYIQAGLQYTCGSDQENDWPVVGIRERCA
jgi:hypothetical protein